MKRLVFLLWTPALLLSLIFPAHVRAALSPAPDVVLLIDVSGSMNITDVNRAMPDSVNALIDRVAADGGRVGIVTFSGTLKYILPISDLSDEAEREQVKQRISRSVYNGYTDIGQVLLKSAELLNERDDLRNPMVLLFTDGMIEINPNTTRRTAEQSYDDTLAALDALSGQAKVYAVGLDDGDRVDRPLLSTISSSGGGDSGGEDIFIATDASQLPALFQSAYESHVPPEVPAIEAAPDETVTEETPIDGTVAEETMTEETPPDENASDENAGNKTSPDENTSGETVLDENMADGTLPGENMADNVPPNETTEVEPTPAAPIEEPTPAPAPTETSSPSPTAEETPAEEEPWRPGTGILIALVVLVLMAVVISARWLLRLLNAGTANASGRASFDVTLSAPLGGEKVPTVSLDADIGAEGLPLAELVEAATGGQRLLKVNTNGLNLFMKRKGGQNALLLTGKARCEISDATNTILAQKNIWWPPNERLTFIDLDMTKLEITYTKGDNER